MRSIEAVCQSPKYLDNSLIWRSFVNSAKKTNVEKRAVLGSCVLTTQKTDRHSRLAKECDCMKEYWYIFLIAIFCAIFSKQIDSVMARVIKGKKNRIVFYCVFCAVMLGIIGFLIYGALSRV